MYGYISWHHYKFVFKFQSLNLKEERKSHSEKQNNFVTILVCFPGKYQNPLIFRI